MGGSPTSGARASLLLVCAAIVVLAVEPPAALALPVVGGFVLLGPGLLTLDLPELSGVRVPAVVATSLGAAVVVSELLLVLGWWSGRRALLVLLGLTALTATARLLARDSRATARTPVVRRAPARDADGVRRR